jgi:hypothetical protein
MERAGDLVAGDRFVAVLEHPTLPAVLRAHGEVLARQVLEFREELIVNRVDAETGVGMAGNKGDAALHNRVGQDLLVVCPANLSGHLLQVVKGV